MPPTALQPFSRTANRALRTVPVWLVYLLGVMPALWLVWLLVSGGLGPDPVKPLEHALGLHALQFLIAALCVTPLLRLAGVNLMRFRRALGLLGFTYVVMHLGVWLALDIQLRWAEIGRDILKRPYITIGMLGFLMLIPLAWTSTDAAMRRMGPVAWRRLHRLAYVATLLGGLHYLMVVKAWPPQPIVYLGLILAILSLRLIWLRR